MTNEVPVIDPRLHQAQDSALFTGSELIVKGALETPGGVQLFTGCPAGTVAGVFDVLRGMTPLLESHGTVARVAANESLAVGMAAGLQLPRGRALLAFNTAGLQKAADALTTANVSAVRGPSSRGAPGGGAVVVVGEDAWSQSTQSAADARFLAEHIQLPLIEPADPSELKDWIAKAFQIGSAGQLFVGFLVDSLLSAGGGTVQCRQNQYPTLTNQKKANLRYHRDIEPALDHAILLPPRTAQREEGMTRRLEAIKRTATSVGVNQIIHGPHRGETVPLGFVAAGSAYASLAAALSEMGLFGRIPILKLGMTWPVDEQLVKEFAGQCHQIVVIEQRRSFVERQIRQIVDELKQAGELTTTVFGKQFPSDLPGVPETSGLNPSILIERLVPLVRNHSSLPIELTNGRLTAELDLIQETGARAIRAAERTPTFCAGCPHRDSSSVLLELRQDLTDHEYMLRNHKRKPVEVLFHGDAGCISLLGFDPNRPLMHSYTGMGLGGAAGSGAGEFIENKQVAFMGDGTFFGTGQQAIRQSIASGDDITYIILDNHTAAMSGQHKHLGDERDLMGHKAIAQQVERTIEGMLPRKMVRDVRLVRINPSDRKRYRKLLEESILDDGVKIIVADKECAVTRLRGKESTAQTTDLANGPIRQTHMNIATDVCDMCHECTTKTGCPGLTLQPTDHGPKVQTDLSVCIDDRACQRLNACPAFEQVTVIRSASVEQRLMIGDLPTPPRPVHADHDIWRCVVAGIGGMGVNKTTAVLAAAGQQMGYDVQYVAHRGIAVRTGSVIGQAVFTRRSNQRFATPLTPYGKANLLVGLDLLETARLFDASLPYRSASANWTSAVVNDHLTPTSQQLVGQEAYDPAALRDVAARVLPNERRWMQNVTETTERWLGSAQYSNMVMLGVAYQQGLLPLTLEAIEHAIWSVFERDAAVNLKALALGRIMVARPRQVAVPTQPDAKSPVQTLHYKAKLLRDYGRPGTSLSEKAREKLSRQYRRLIARFYHEAGDMDAHDSLLKLVAIVAYDCVIWGGFEYARKYVDLLLSVREKDSAAQNFALTRAAARSLANTMLVKDEVYVAALLTSPRKYEADKQRFRINTRAGDRLQYRHYTRPQIELFGKKLTWEGTLGDWQLRLIARCGMVRWLVPGYHRREFKFRNWYERLVKRLDWLPDNGTRDYQRWLAILSTPQRVSGFREVRYPRMAAAQRLAEEWLVTDPQLFEPPATTGDTEPTDNETSGTGRTVHLDVMASA